MKRQACRQAGKLAGCLSRLADRQVARGGVVVRSSAMQKRLSFLAVCSLLIQVPLRNALLFSLHLHLHLRARKRCHLVVHCLFEDLDRRLPASSLPSPSTSIRFYWSDMESRIAL